MTDPNQTTDPVAGQTWATQSRYVPVRRVVKVTSDPMSGVPVIRYRRGKESGERSCSLMAWRSWAADNRAELQA